MDTEIKQKLASCFGRNSGTKDWNEALSYAKKNLNKIDFDDDSDMEELIDIVLCALQCGEDHTEFLEFLISNGFDLNYKLVGDDCLLLKYMKDSPKLSLIKKLIALGADVRSETLDGDNALSLLSEKDESSAVYMAETYDLTMFDRTDKYGVTPLMYAAKNGYIQLAKLLIGQGFDVNAAGCEAAGDKSLDIETDGVTPLAFAIRFGNFEMVRLLLKAGADEMAYDSDGKPPVFSLISYPSDFFLGPNRHNDAHPIFEEKQKIVSLLTQIDLTDADGYTVLMKSLFPMKFWYTGHGEGISPQKNLPVTLALIKKGADVDAAGNDGRRPLHQAVTASEEAVRGLVKAGADLNAQDNEGNTPLIFACREAKEEIALWLLKAGADKKPVNNEGKTAEDYAAERGFARALERMGAARSYLYACKNNQKNALQVLLKRGGSDINECDESGCTPLIYACMNNAPDMVKMLLDHGADTEIGSPMNRMPLHYAAEAGNIAVINLLVNAGANVNPTDSEGVSPLMIMAGYGKSIAALSFIKNPEVDVNVKDNCSRTAIVYAIFSGKQQLVKALLPGAEADDSDSYGNTILHYACYHGLIDIVKLLLEKSKKSVGRTNDDGETPLFMSVRKSNLVIAKLLLSEGAEVNRPNLKGIMPLHMAAYNGDVFMGKELLAAGADINAKTEEGQTPLMYAVISGRAEFADMLLKAGAEVNGTDNSQHSALYYAAEAKLQKTVEQLLAAGAEN